uniref:Uncharacterized protein n=1 Tax=Bracon brevicornis TaxID=1563983 RepID=A0A6V7ITB1_9HYME
MMSFLVRTEIVDVDAILATVPVEVHDILRNVPLPPSQIEQLRLAFGSMASKARRWLRKFEPVDFVQVQRVLDMTRIWHANWTYLGCIHLPTTYRSLWLLGNLETNFDTWLLLCSTCDEATIRQFWRTINYQWEYCELVARIRALTFSEDSLGYYWKCYLISDLVDYTSTLRNEGLMLTIDEEMFEDCFKNNTYYGFKYFWERLDDDQRKRRLESLRMWLLNVELDARFHDTHWFRDSEHDLHSIVFLVRQYSHYGFDEFVDRMLKSPLMLSKMMVTWPCRVNLMTALEEAWQRNQYIDYEPIVSRLIQLRNIDRAYLQNFDRARILFCRIWDKGIPAFRKAIFSDPLAFLWNDRDVELLAYMAIHQESWTTREQLLGCYIDYHMHPPTNWYFLKDLVDEICKEVDVRDWFIREFVTRGFSQEHVLQQLSGNH